MVEFVQVRHVLIETAHGWSGVSGTCVHAPVALVSSSAFAALLPLGLTGLGVQASSMAMWKTASATSVLAVVSNSVSYLVEIRC